jgi:hypothetical protein
LIGVAMATAGIQPTAAAGAQATPTGDDRVVCRRDDQVGTRLAPRVCLTRAQWRQRNTESRRNARDLMDESGRTGGLTAPTPAGSGG